MPEQTERSYKAFISYRHLPLDKQAAELIQKRIENYTIPKELRKDPEQKRLGFCFRDEDELPASSSLSESIYYALDHSEYLIVICTPDLPLSKWCEQEIRYFTRTHDRDHVLAVLADGTPDVSFPPLLLHEYDEDGNESADCEPLAANIASPDHSIDKKAFRKEIVRIYAALIDCPFDALWQREKRARTARLLSFAGVVLAAALVFLGVLMDRNAKIREKNLELSRQVSSVLTDAGFSKLKGLDLDGAAADAAEAISSRDASVYDHRALQLITKAADLYQTDARKSFAVRQFDVSLADLWVTQDEKHVILLEKTGNIRCLAMDGFGDEWSFMSADAKANVYTAFPDRILVKTIRGLYALSLADGSVIWSFEQQGYFEKNYFQALSPDTSVFAVLDKASAEEAGDEDHYCVRFLNTADGSCENSCLLDFPNYTPALLSTSGEEKYSAAFSEDGKVLVFALPVMRTEEDGSKTLMVLILMIDLETMKADKVVGNDSMQIYEGFFINDQHDTLLLSSLSGAGVLWMLKCPMPFVSADEVTYSTIGHHFQTPTGYGQSLLDFSRINRCRMLVGKGKALVFSDNTMFVFSSDTTVSKKICPMSGQIVNAYWTDEETGFFEVVCSDGWVIDYELTDKLFGQINGKTFGISMDRAVPVGGSMIRGDKGSFFLSISAERPGQLVKSVYHSDPDERLMNFAEVKAQTVSGIRFIPEGNTGVIAARQDPESQKYPLVFFDRKTGEVLSSFEADSMDGRYMLPLDPEHVIYGGKITNAGGEMTDYAEAFYSAEEVEDGLNAERHPEESIRLSDGRIMSVGKYIDFDLQNSLPREESYSSWYPEACPVWIDGKLLESSGSKEKIMIMKNWWGNDNGFAPSGFSLGANGLAVRYGIDIAIEGNQVTEPEKPRFSVFNANDQSLIRIEDPYPEADERTVVPANQKNLMAVCFDGMHLTVYDCGSGTNREIPGYSAGEIMAMAFSNDDRFLAVLGMSGKIDLYDADSLQLKGSAASEMYQSMILENNVEYTSLQVTAFDEGIICICAEYNSQRNSACVILDLPAETLLAEINYVLAVDTVNRFIYAERNTGDLVRYPLRMPEEIVEFGLSEDWLNALTN